jgi:DNA polymerase-1
MKNYKRVGAKVNKEGSVAQVEIHSCFLSDKKLTDDIKKEIREEDSSIKKIYFIDKLGNVDANSMDSFKCSYLIADKDNCQEILDTIKGSSGYIAIDIEASSGDPETCEVYGMSITTTNYHNYYFPFVHDNVDDLLDLSSFVDFLESLLKDNMKFVVHNLSYEKIIFERLGLDMTIDNLEDTQCLCYVYDSTNCGKRSSLKNLSLRNFQARWGSFEELFIDKVKDGRKTKKVNNYTSRPLEVGAQYCCSDTFYTMKLWERYSRHLKSNGGHIYDSLYKAEKSCLEATHNLSLVGVPFSKTILQNAYEELEKVSCQLMKDMKAEVGDESFNPSSGKQLGKYLYEDCDIIDAKNSLWKIAKHQTEKGSWKTDEKTLKSLYDKTQNEFLQKILDYRSVLKIQGTYIKKFLENIDDNYRYSGDNFKNNSMGTETGRFSGNMHQLPKEDANKYAHYVRNAIRHYKDDYVIIAFDYKQIEPRIAAKISNDRNLIQGFRDGLDPYKVLALSVYNKNNVDDVAPEERKSTKQLLLALSYGQGEKATQKALKISKEDTTILYDKFNKGAPNLSKTVKDSIEFTKQYGYAQTLFGRRRKIDNINSRGWDRFEAERKCFNTRIQGTGSDIMKLSIKKCREEIPGFDDVFFLQVHDEIVLCCHKDDKDFFINEVKRCMEDPSTEDTKEVFEDLVIHVDYDVGVSYADAK